MGPAEVSLRRLQRKAPGPAGKHPRRSRSSGLMLLAQKGRQRAWDRRSSWLQTYGSSDVLCTGRVRMLSA